MPSSGAPARASASCSRKAARSKARTRSNRWIVDPLDGTTNFLHGLPHFSISIGLERDGKPHAGVIYDPIRDETFWAENGAGAFLNNQRLRVSARRALPQALLATGLPFKARERCPGHGATVHRLAGESAGVRRLGSAALDLAYVAAGRLDGFWSYALAPWDLAAGIAIVREAGGIVTEIAGGADAMASGDVLASNGHLHGTLREAIGFQRSGVSSDGASSSGYPTRGTPPAFIFISRKPMVREALPQRTSRFYEVQRRRGEGAASCCSPSPTHRCGAGATGSARDRGKQTKSLKRDLDAGEFSPSPPASPEPPRRRPFARTAPIL